MIKCALFCFIVSAVVVAIAEAGRFTCTDKNTDVYNSDEYDNVELYQANTFINNNDRCLDLGSPSKKRYMEILDRNNITCTGLWCVNGRFDWTKDHECFEVEHIIDRRNTPYVNCSPNILGNVVMVYGLWNNQIGQMCWNDIKTEKFEVYGKGIFCNALRNVIECSGCNVPLTNECLNVSYNNVSYNITAPNIETIYISTPKSAYVVIGILVALLIIGAIGIIVTVYGVNKKVLTNCYSNSQRDLFSRLCKENGYEHSSDSSDDADNVVALN